MNKTALFFTAILLFSACAEQEKTEGHHHDHDSRGWLEGDDQQKFETIARQFGGFDATMVEMGYRYQELYWAGKDENWGYADHQVEHMRKAIELGLERRPERARSAEHFITEVLPQMEKAVASKDTSIFNEQFAVLTTGCNNCHAMEKLPFFTVKKPLERQSPIR